MIVTNPNVTRSHLDAITEEASACWFNERLMPETTSPTRRADGAQARGYRLSPRGPSAISPNCRDVLTLDFSGWTILVHEEAEDAQICAALDARAGRAFPGRRSGLFAYEYGGR